MASSSQAIGTQKQKYRNGYEQTLTKYQAPNCQNCPLRGMCHKQTGNRKIEVNHHQRRLKKTATERLRSEEAIKKRKKRCADVEPVFANWKQNKSFRRFHLRGKQKGDDRNRPYSPGAQPTKVHKAVNERKPSKNGCIKGGLA